MTRSLVCASLLTILVAAPAAAQNEAALRSYFEGKGVTLRIDMPATADGVEIAPQASQPLNYQQYGDRVRRYGVAIRTGESSVVTLVKVKRDLIEFQLGGGGYGTFGDDTSGSVNMPDVEKTNREKDLERQVKAEGDPAKKKALQRELDDLKNARERENRRIEATRTIAETQKKSQIADQRIKGGSRFNVHYPAGVPEGLKPQELIAALSAYVDFSGADVRTTPSAPAAPTGPRKGMLRADAERQYGKPITTAERREGEFQVVTLVFVSGEQRITAEFIQDVLIRYSIASK